MVGGGRSLVGVMSIPIGCVVIVVWFSECIFRSVFFGVCHVSDYIPYVRVSIDNLAFFVEQSIAADEIDPTHFSVS